MKVPGLRAHHVTASRAAATDSAARVGDLSVAAARLPVVRAYHSPGTSSPATRPCPSGADNAVDWKGAGKNLAPCPLRFQMVELEITRADNIGTKYLTVLLVA
jgi:hypothetical protein